MDNFPVGSIVRRRLDGMAGWFAWHWGIYVGHDEVVHFNGLVKKQRNAIIRLDSVEAFGAGHRIILHRHPKDRSQGLATARKAREIQDVAENGFNGTYQFLFNNCQDFCRCCIET